MKKPKDLKTTCQGVPLTKSLRTEAKEKLMVSCKNERIKGSYKHKNVGENNNEKIINPKFRTRPDNNY